MDVAKKHNKPYEVVYEVYMAQFKLVRDTMRSLEFKTIKLPSFGKYIAGSEKTIKFKENLNYFYDKNRTNDNKDTPLQGEE